MKSSDAFLEGVPRVGLNINSELTFFLDQGDLSIPLPGMSFYNSEAPVLDTYQAVVSAYSDFLTVAIHTILYERNIYPQTSFIKARKYNYPVRQSRHPRLCKWIIDAVASVEAEMLKVKKLLREL